MVGAAHVDVLIRTRVLLYLMLPSGEGVIFLFFHVRTFTMNKIALFICFFV